MNRPACLLTLFLVAATGCSRPEQPAAGGTSSGTSERPASGSASPAITEVASPAGANAAEPFVFAGRNGVWLSWLEPVAGTKRTALRVSQHANGQWSAPKTIVERDDLFVNWADFPSVIEDERGALFAHWLQKSGSGTYAYDVRMATSTDGGATWSAPFLLNRDGKQAEHGFVTLAPLPGGGVGATWLDGRNMSAGDHEGHDGHDAGDMTIRYANVAADGTLTSDIELDTRTCECCTTGMAMTTKGPVIVYRDRSPEEIRDISYIRSEGETWSAPKPLRADGWKINGCPVNGPQIDAIGNDVVTAWFTAAEGKQRVFLKFSTDGGVTFGDAIQVDDGKPQGRVDVVLLDSQTALVTWLEQTDQGAETRARRITRGAAPAGSFKVADSGTARATGFTRIARSGKDVWFTWTEQSGTDKRIHLARGSM